MCTYNYCSFLPHILLSLSPLSALTFHPPSLLPLSPSPSCPNPSPNSLMSPCSPLTTHIQTTRASHLYEESHYEVWRRYRDFEWLRQQVERLYPTLIIPVCVMYWVFTSCHYFPHGMTGCSKESAWNCVIITIHVQCTCTCTLACRVLLHFTIPVKLRTQYVVCKPERILGLDSLYMYVFTCLCIN